MKFSIILLSVAIIWGVAVITPGPNFFITVKTAIGQTRRSALFVALGTSTGTILWGLSGFFGIALLFKTAPWIYLSLKLLGGTYLIYLGLKLIISNTRAESNHRVSISANIDPIQGYKLGYAFKCTFLAWIHECGSNVLNFDSLVYISCICFLLRPF